MLKAQIMSVQQKNPTVLPVLATSFNILAAQYCSTVNAVVIID